MGTSVLTSAQCRAARALIDWSREQLAEASRVGLRTIVDFERGARGPREVTLEALRRALETAGVIFIAENGEGPGVRVRKTQENAAELARRIGVLEDDLAKSKGPLPRTPAGGMQTLERAHKRNAVTKLKNKRTNLKTGK